jgi:cation diffusion facilitator family transporter
MSPAAYEPVKGDLHRHGALRHAHPHAGPHEHQSHHGHGHPRDDHGEHAHGHSHGLVDESIKRSREGIRAVALALAVLAATAAVQAVVFALTGSLALLADLIHNGGDALTAIPLGIAFAVRSPRAERLAGVAVVAAIFISACVAAYESILRLIHPSAPGHLPVLALAGAVGFAGNRLAALVRGRAGRRLESPALTADGDHARADAYVSLAVIASATATAAGAPILDPVIGLGMTAVILRITRESWRTVHRQLH